MTGPCYCGTCTETPSTHASSRDDDTYRHTVEQVHLHPWRGSRPIRYRTDIHKPAIYFAFEHHLGATRVELSPAPDPRTLCADHTHGKPKHGPLAIANSHGSSSGCVEEYDRSAEGEWDIFWMSVERVQWVFGKFYLRLGSAQIINHFPNHFELTHKDRMYKNIKRYLHKYPDLHLTSPLTWCAVGACGSVPSGSSRQGPRRAAGTVSAGTMPAAAAGEHSSGRSKPSARSPMRNTTTTATTNHDSARAARGLHSSAVMLAHMTSTFHLQEGVPLTFYLPNEVRMFALELHRAGRGSMWIVKPPHSSQGRGIFLITQLSHILDRLSDGQSASAGIATMHSSSQTDSGQSISGITNNSNSIKINYNNDNNNTNYKHNEGSLSAMPMPLAVDSSRSAPTKVGMRGRALGEGAPGTVRVMNTSRIATVTRHAHMSHSELSASNTRDADAERNEGSWGKESVLISLPNGGPASSAQGVRSTHETHHASHIYSTDNTNSSTNNKDDKENYIGTDKDKRKADKISNRANHNNASCLNENRNSSSNNYARTPLATVPHTSVDGSVASRVTEAMYAAGLTLIVCRYVDRPLLIGGKKFDLRLYVLVTSFQPLVAYLHELGFARFCTALYTGKKGATANLGAHLTNVALQQTDAEYNSTHGGKLSFGDLLLYLQARHGAYATAALRARIEFVIFHSLKAVGPVMHNDPHSFELYGYDILVDAELRPHLIEVNASPSLKDTTDADRFMKQQVLIDVMKIVLPPHYPDRTAMSYHEYRTRTDLTTQRHTGFKLLVL